MGGFSRQILKYAVIPFVTLVLFLSLYVHVHFLNVWTSAVSGYFKYGINTLHGKLREANTSSCVSLMSMQATDDSLLEFYQTCVNNRPNTHQLVGPDLFNQIFVSDVFRGVTCEETNKTFIKGQDLVALASIPGSYNTWTRILLEQMTGKVFGVIDQLLSNAVL